MFSFDITFCHNPTCKHPHKCRRDPARLKNYTYPVSMADLNAFDSDGNCTNFYPVETPKNEKIDEGDALFIAYLLTRHKPRRKQKAVKA